MAQNLVPNPSFETYTLCPDNISGLSDDQVSRATGWSSFCWSSDYFNSCASNTQVSTPMNYLGYQKAYDGQAYCGIILKSSANPEAREIVGIQLTQPLQIGTKYFVSFMSSLSLELQQGLYALSNASTNKLGAKFTKTSYTILNPPTINNSTHIVSNTFIIDTLNWTQIFGSFVADSAYNYIMIGNFFDDASTPTIHYFGSPTYTLSYYFIDKVIVSKESIEAAGTVGIYNHNSFKNSFLFPNPFQNHLKIISESEVLAVSIMSQLGIQCFYLANPKSSELHVDMSEYPNGIYYVEIEALSNKSIHKLIKIN